MTVEAKDSQPPYTFLAFLATETASTDSIKVLKGTVLDSASKEPMPGVSLYWKGTSIGVSTNAEGKFNLVVPENQIPIPQILVVTYIGYLKQEISLEDLLTNQNPVIGLSPDLISRVEIVVTAICAEKPGFKKVLSSPKKKE
ncbi:carboxypeptidase-like regulatory domain-containing protein [Rufibacter sp. DG15C]|uniref:carboxypeptidase-like regulatory domain-containing protein n=1 Tax=Rufibacter sp. DG15C TaxID=1379909 RepID=UPI0018D2F6DE|nr:carboxypeptidase-like regulatory domain-containing protein [Rufibacter sp. DG15C]